MDLEELDDGVHPAPCHLVGQRLWLLCSGRDRRDVQRCDLGGLVGGGSGGRGRHLDQCLHLLSGGVDMGSRWSIGYNRDYSGAWMVIRRDEDHSGTWRVVRRNSNCSRGWRFDMTK